MEIKGYDKLIKDLQKLGTKGHDVVEQATARVAGGIELKAKQLAPVDLGKLRQGIKALQVDDLTYKIVANERYSAYQEFGTGGMVEVPQELYDIAIQFKGKGIRQVNIPPQAFLYPAFVEGRVKYIEELKIQLDKLTKDV